MYSKCFHPFLHVTLVHAVFCLLFMFGQMTCSKGNTKDISFIIIHILFCHENDSQSILIKNPLHLCLKAQPMFLLSAGKVECNCHFPAPSKNCATRFP
jgi:hypothetical protein